MTGQGPHSRACGVRRHEHGPDCHRNCPTCGGRGDAPPKALTDPHAQVGPGYVLTTHGPVRRATPPWDVPAGPDYTPPDSVAAKPIPGGTVEALDAQIRTVEILLDQLRKIRERLVR